MNEENVLRWNDHRSWKFTLSSEWNNVQLGLIWPSRKGLAARLWQTSFDFEASWIFVVWGWQRGTFIPNRTFRWVWFLEHEHGYCNGRLSANANSAKPLCPAAMTHSEAKRNDAQSTADYRTPSRSVEQHTDLKLNRLETRGQARIRPDTVACGLIESGLILWQAQRQAEAAFGMKIED